MKESPNIYLGGAILFDRLADDGWPEDAGRWPIGYNAPPVISEGCIEETVIERSWRRLRRLWWAKSNQGITQE